MNSFDNERVEVADVRGTVARDLSGAFSEWYPHSRATKWKTYLYSLSPNPDQIQGSLTREQYIDLVARTGTACATSTIKSVHAAEIDAVRIRSDTSFNLVDDNRCPDSIHCGATFRSSSGRFIANAATTRC